MTSMTYRILKTSRFKNLYSWSVLNATPAELNFSDKYNRVKIGSLLRKSKNTILINDDKTYKRVTVKLYGGGVKVRDEVLGKEIKTKRQFVLKEGQFLYSRIDARNGAFGLADKEVDNAIVSNEFPIYDVDTSLVIPEFLVLITSSKPFYDFCQSLSSGSTGRQRIDESRFLSFEVPLPDISIQIRIVEQHKHNITTAQEAENEANELEKQIENYLFSELGIEKPKTIEKKEGLQFVRFKDLSRWGVVNSLAWKTISKYKSIKVEDICKVSSGGTPNRNNLNYYENGNIPWIKTGELNNEIIYNTEEKITNEGLKNSSAKLYGEGSLIIAMYGATIGKTAKLGIKATTNQACAVMFDINNNLVRTDFLWIYLQLHVELFKSMAQGSAQPNLNANIIKKFNIQLPNLETQDALISYFFSQKERIKSLRQQAEELRKQAKETFENEIFA